MNNYSSVSLVSGIHITTTEKKHILHLLNNGLMSGKINNRKTYFIAAGNFSDKTFTVEILEPVKEWFYDTINGEVQKVFRNPKKVVTIKAN